MNAQILFFLKQGQVPHPKLLLYLLKKAMPYIAIWLLIGPIYADLAHIISTIILINYFLSFNKIELEIRGIIQPATVIPTTASNEADPPPPTTTTTNQTIESPPIPTRYIQVSLKSCQEYGILEEKTNEALTQAKVNTLQKRMSDSVVFSKKHNAHFAPIEALTNAGYLITKMPTQYYTYNNKRIIEINN